MVSYRQGFFFFFFTFPCQLIGGKVYLQLCCRDVKNTFFFFFFFVRLISFDNSLSGGIGGLVVGSAICSSLSPAPALCCQDHYAVCNNGELCCLL